MTSVKRSIWKVCTVGTVGTVFTVEEVPHYRRPHIIEEVSVFQSHMEKPS